MLQRCMNPKNTDYHSYGGRGITVCKRWLVFENFARDVGKRPAPHLTLDRIKNDGNYEPGNVQWADYSQQRRNQRPKSVSCVCGRCTVCRVRRNTQNYRARKRAREQVTGDLPTST